MDSVPLNVIQKAKERIREDESRKKQSLKQYREWLTKHAFIKYCRTDDIYLLPHLRARKYRMDSVFDCFEKSIIFGHQHRDWIDFNGEKYERILELYDTGFLKVMKQRDSEGRRIVICNNTVDLDKFNVDDLFRLHSLIVLGLTSEEETQLCGIIFVNDYTNGISMKYLTMVPLKSIYDFTLQLTFMPLRLCNLIIVGLPSIATQVLNVVKLGLTNKMRDRLIVLENRSQLHEHIDKSILTTDFGGDADEREAIDLIRKEIDERVHIARDFFDTFEVDIEKATMLKKVHENVGSFRKLEID